MSDEQTSSDEKAGGGFFKKLILAIAAVIVLIIAVLIIFVSRLDSYAKTPFDPAGGEVRFEVEKGQKLRTTALKLEQAGVIDRKNWFVLLARVTKNDSKIRAGEYLLSPSMPPWDVLGVLVKGKAILHRLTIPEGVDMKWIAAEAEVRGFGSYNEYLRLARDREFAASLGIEEDSLEGYLFPDTYYFLKGAQPKKVLKTMTARFDAVFTDEWKKRAKELGMTVHEVVTLASIIEKETGVAYERELISSVFHNRLKKGMLLQSDPTVIYGIKDFDGNITKKHLQTPTPYNTYTNRGLPPGPIASPGAEALKAALYPAKTGYLYFVATRNKTHKFSTNYAEHNIAVREYQLRRKRPRKGN